ncbi:MAG: tyrosine-type recombinase/integrase [Gaiellaceae bacterium MAG52_C11]|nr:tyrosine-type recombinase/integrase [Candidatus Gaiellasilicea maunaloa]
MFVAGEGRKVRRTFPTLAAARTWRADALSAAQRGVLRAPSARTVREAAEELIDGMESGSVRSRSGDRYRPSATRSYRAALAARIVPALGAMKLTDVRRRHVQKLVDEMLRDGVAPSTIRNALMPLRVIFRRAIESEELAVSPSSGLRLPAVRGRRDQIVTPHEAAALLAALPAGRDRALWATAIYAGLRRGELMALRWSDVDVAGGVIRVERSYDPGSRTFGLPKSRAGVRRVPIAAALRDLLLELRLDAADESGLVFGGSTGQPFDISTITERARRAWADSNARRSRDEDSLKPLTLHGGRHTFASLMIAADVNAKALSSYMGHASITITLDRYGHLMPGNEDEAAALLDAYLERADTRARLTALASPLPTESD